MCYHSVSGINTKGIIAMKKLLSVIICISLLASIFVFVACDTTSAGGEETTSSTVTKDEGNTEGETTAAEGTTSTEENTTEGNGTGNNEETTTESNGNGTGNNEETTTESNGTGNNEATSTTTQGSSSNNEESSTSTQQSGNNVENSGNSGNNTDNSNAYELYLMAVRQIKNEVNYTVDIAQSSTVTMNGTAQPAEIYDILVLVDGHNQIIERISGETRRVSHYIDGVYYIIGNGPEGKKWAMDQNTYDSVYSDVDSYMLPDYPQSWFTPDMTTITKESGKQTLVLSISPAAYIEYMVGLGMSAEGAPDFEKIELSVTIGEDGRIESWTTYTSFSQGSNSLVGKSTATFSAFGTTVVTTPKNLDDYIDPSAPPTDDGNGEDGGEENGDNLNKEDMPVDPEKEKNDENSPPDNSDEVEKEEQDKTKEDK